MTTFRKQCEITLAEAVAEIMEAATDRNDHNGSAMALAIAYGTKAEQEAIENLEKAQAERGYMQQDEIEARSAIAQTISQRVVTFYPHCVPALNGHLWLKRD